LAGPVCPEIAHVPAPARGRDPCGLGWGQRASIAEKGRVVADVLRLEAASRSGSGTAAESGTAP
jgi:hypothetical protein